MSQKVISFHYSLTNRAGETVDSSQGGAPFSFLSGAGQVIPGLEKELILLSMGQKKKIDVPFTEAYGARNEELVVKVSPDKLPSNEVKLGDQFKGGDGGEHTQIFTVVSVTESEVVLDGNHPLAGEDLFFDVELIATREATQQEIEHGHLHGPDGHGHHH